MSERITRLSQVEYPAIAFFLSLLSLVAHGQSLKASWRWDDGAHLSFAIIFSPWQYFFEPNITRAHTSANIAPWNILFYDINLTLFGFNPTGHYAHLLLIIIIGSILFYAVLRQWLPPLSATIGAITLLLGKPTFHIAAGLMHGHYATGFLLAMLSILTWTLYIKNGQTRYLTTSAFAYLLATTCKEVYVPLVLLLPFLPTGTLKQRIRGLPPFILIAMAYTGWRYVVLGGLIGGYSQGAFNPTIAMHQLYQIPQLLIGTKPAGIFIGASFITLLCIAIARKRLNWLLCAVIFGIVILPLLPLTTFPGIHNPDRYLFIPWLAFSACLAATFPDLEPPSISLLTGVLTIAAMAAIHQQGKKEIKDDLIFWDAIYPFAISAEKLHQAIFIGIDDDGYKRLVLTSARNAADHFAKNKNPGHLQIIDERGNGLLRAKLEKMQVFEFSKGKMSLMSEGKLAEKFPKYLTLEPPKNIPLSINLKLRGKKLFWKFGPDDGNYYINSHSSPQGSSVGMRLPREGSTPWTDDEISNFSFCHENIQTGITACSPALIFDLKATGEAAWQGVGQYSSHQYP